MNFKRTYYLFCCVHTHTSPNTHKESTIIPMVTWKAFIAFRTHFLRLRFGAKVRQPLENVKKCLEIVILIQSFLHFQIRIYSSFTQVNSGQNKSNQKKTKQRTLTVFPEWISMNSVNHDKIQKMEWLPGVLPICQQIQSKNL